MGILMSTEIKQQISNEVKQCRESLQVITAFCKVSGISFLDKGMVNDVARKRIMVRFRMEDIISGASDLEIYNYCKNNNWELYVRFDLHAKTYIFDNKRCVIGSANLTSKGLNLINGGNYEIASICCLDIEDVEKTNKLFKNAVLMNDIIFQKMKNEINSVGKANSTHNEWTSEITKLFMPDFSVLFTYDFPMYQSFKECMGERVDFLDLDADWSESELKEAFRYSKAYLWLKTLILENGNEMYFGEVTANLHNVLVNDPKPYRKEVKELLARLLQWIQDLHMEEIQVDRPNYSQRITVIN
jgi:hypothetical protein